MKVAKPQNWGFGARSASGGAGGRVGFGGATHVDSDGESPEPGAALG